MITIKIQNNFPEVARRMKQLRHDLADKAMAAALNATADKGRTEAKRAITSEYAIKSSEVNAQIKVKRASAKGSQLIAIIDAMPGSRRGRSMNVVHFLRRRVTKAQAAKGKQLGFVFKRGSGRKEIPGSFLGNQGRTVFKRIGQARLPIEAVSVIGVPSMFNARAINAKVIKKINEEFPRQFGRAARKYLNKW